MAQVTWPLLPPWTSTSVPRLLAGKEGQWIKTTPGKGWFTYLRLYGPEQPAFDGSWKPGDFEQVK